MSGVGWSTLIKESVSPIDLVDRMGYEITRDDFILCPFHQDIHPSMKIYERRFKCFVCGVSYNVVDFMMKLNQCNFKVAVQLINDIMGLDIVSRKPSWKDIKRIKESAKKAEYKRKAIKWAVDTLFNYRKFIDLCTEYNFPYYQERYLKDREFVDYLIDCYISDSEGTTRMYWKHFKDFHQFLNQEWWGNKDIESTVVLQGGFEI